MPRFPFAATSIFPRASPTVQRERGHFKVYLPILRRARQVSTAIERSYTSRLHKMKEKGRNTAIRYLKGVPGLYSCVLVVGTNQNLFPCLFCN